MSTYLLNHRLQRVNNRIDNFNKIVRLLDLVRLSVDSPNYNYKGLYTESKVLVNSSMFEISIFETNWWIAMNEMIYAWYQKNLQTRQLSSFSRYFYIPRFSIHPICIYVCVCVCICLKIVRVWECADLVTLPRYRRIQSGKEREREREMRESEK